MSRKAPPLSRNARSATGSVQARRTWSAPCSTVSMAAIRATSPASAIPTPTRIPGSCGTKKPSPNISRIRAPRSRVPKWSLPASKTNRKLRTCGPTSSNSMPRATSRNRPCRILLIRLKRDRCRAHISQSRSDQYRQNSLGATGGSAAMIKDIVVNLSVGEKVSPACDYAVSVAAAFDAHLAGIAFLYDPIVPVSGAGYIPADVIDAQERENEEATRAALDRFNTACSRAGVGAEPLTLSASFAGVGEQFSRIARRFDLSIVGQAEPESSAVEEIIAESALFESGRPVIVVPYIQKEPFKLDNVMVC